MRERITCYQSGSRRVPVAEFIEGETPAPESLTFRKVGDLLGILNSRQLDSPRDTAGRRSFASLLIQWRKPEKRTRRGSLLVG